VATFTGVAEHARCRLSGRDAADSPQGAQIMEWIVILGIVAFFLWQVYE